ncbi:hypothetical protein [Shimia sp.]|uniref:hypothetical protein n=1 Tax=Shimia sp. TaxID=1954381 RepID=UPI003B8B697A
MKKVLFVGNSHLGAIRRGWSETPAAWDGWEADFFALPSTHFLSAELHGDGLFGVGHLGMSAKPAKKWAQRINEKTDVSYQGADLIVHVGANLMANQIFPILSKYSIDGFLESGATKRMSKDAFETFCIAVAKSNSEFGGWDSTETPQIIAPKPRHIETALDQFDRFMYDDNLRDLCKKSDLLSRVYDLFEDIYERQAQAAAWKFVRQPANTITELGLTAPKYASGAKILVGDDTAQSDFGHMNSEYGGQMLNAIYAAMSEHISNSSVTAA